MRTITAAAAITSLAPTYCQTGAPSVRPHLTHATMAESRDAVKATLNAYLGSFRVTGWPDIDVEQRRFVKTAGGSRVVCDRFTVTAGALLFHIEQDAEEGAAPTLTAFVQLAAGPPFSFKLSDELAQVVLAKALSAPGFQPGELIDDDNIIE